MCFKKLTVKNVLTCTLLLFFLGIFSLALVPGTTMAGNGSVDPPPPDNDTLIVPTSAGPSDTDPTTDSSDTELSTWDLINLVVSVVL